MRPSFCTDDEFQRMRDQHLPWELGMLRKAAEILNRPDPSPDDDNALVVRWLAIEGFYTHCRNLYNFFYGGRKRHDAIATDFFADESEWYAARPKLSRYVKEAADLAGTMVVHLSYDRQANIESGKTLKWVKIATEMQAAYQAFQAALDGSENQLPLGKDFTTVPGQIISFDLGYGSGTTISTPGEFSATRATRTPSGSSSTASRLVRDSST